MSIIREVNIKITGQVDDDYSDNNYNLLLTELNIVCARYKLKIKENNI